jgi:hypothetical protein
MASISIRPVSASMTARSPLPREVLVDMMEGNEEGGKKWDISGTRKGELEYLGQSIWIRRFGQG